MELRSVRGTHDILGKDIVKYNIIKKIVSNYANLRSFSEIQTPIFEFSNLFLKPLGEQSDVVLKEMYTFEDRNKELLTLRPEYTTPMIRSAITNNLFEDLPIKLFGIGPMFRRERPQKGRYRQFNQINFEVFGSDDYLADLELITLANDILKSVLPNSKFNLKINTLGKRKNLIEYKAKLSKYFDDNKNKLSNESREKIKSNPLRILDSKNNEDIELSKNSPSIIDFIDNEDKVHFEELKKGLRLNSINFEENFRLVRGLDYYCKTVFEFKTDNLGSQDTLIGGGRYDGLIAKLGGPDIPGLGWAAGIERILLLMEDIDTKNNKIHLAITNENLKNHLIKLINFLNLNNLPFYWNYKYNLKKSLAKANSKKVSNVIIIGEDEHKNDFYTVKKLSTGQQIKVNLDDIKETLND